MSIESLDPLFKTENFNVEKFFGDFLDTVTSNKLVHFNRKEKKPKSTIKVLKMISGAINELKRIKENTSRLKDQLIVIYQAHLKSLLKIILMTYANGELAINFSKPINIKRVATTPNLLLTAKNMLALTRNTGFEFKSTPEDDILRKTSKNFISVMKIDMNKILSREIESPKLIKRMRKSGNLSSLERNMMNLYLDTMKTIDDALILINSIHYLFILTCFPKIVIDGDNDDDTFLIELLEKFKAEAFLDDIGKIKITGSKFVALAINKEKFNGVIRVMPTLFYYQTTRERRPFALKYNLIHFLSTNEKFNADDPERLTLKFIDRVMKTDFTDDGFTEERTGFDYFDDIFDEILQFMDQTIQDILIPDYMKKITKETSQLLDNADYKDGDRKDHLFNMTQQEFNRNNQLLEILKNIDK